jgi:hypothetical protein
MTSLIQDTFKYFAKFPAKGGVLQNFSKNTSGFFTGYDIYKESIEDLDPHSIISGIDGYVFGSDIASVMKRIEQINGIYLFVDYGNIYNSLIEPMKTEQGQLVIAVTVARKTQPDDLDSIEQVLLSDLTLDMLNQIKNIAMTDNKSSIFLKHMEFPMDITTWFAQDLFNSTGWTMTFKTRGIHLID